MKKAAVVFDDGFEELEAMGPIALLRRAGMEVDLVAANNKDVVIGKFGDHFQPVTPIEDYDFEQADVLILPGGGHYTKLEANPAVIEQIQSFYHNPEKYLAAICAAPTILGRLGLLKDRTYTCFSSMNEDFGGNYVDDAYAVVDDHLITGKSAAAAIDFGFAIMGELLGKDKEAEVKESIYY